MVNSKNIIILLMLVLVSLFTVEDTYAVVNYNNEKTSIADKWSELRLWRDAFRSVPIARKYVILTTNGFR